MLPYTNINNNICNSCKFTLRKLGEIKEIKRENLDTHSRNFAIIVIA